MKTEISTLKKEDLRYFNSHLLPVLSAIEKIMEPVNTDLNKTAKAHKNPPKVLPLVFFWWGEISNSASKDNSNDN